MKVTVNGKKTRVTDDMRENAEKKMAKFDKFFNDDATAVVSYFHTKHTEAVSYTHLDVYKRQLQTQIKHTEEELTYLDTVFDALSRAQSSTDLDEIREELERTGYATRKTQTKKTATRKQYHHMEFVTDEGYTVLCGKNNLQNEYITHTRADRHDWWFHVKNAPGAHVILVTNGQEPDALSFTQAATIAATYSGRGEGEAKHITVDYTQVHNLKKVPGAKPGMVIYHTNYAAYVTPDPGLCERLRVK